MSEKKMKVKCANEYERLCAIYGESPQPDSTQEKQ